MSEWECVCVAQHHTIKNIENYVMYLMESNTQADDDADNQINCVIEPFYFIDDFNEFRGDDSMRHDFPHCTRPHFQLWIGCSLCECDICIWSAMCECYALVVVVAFFKPRAKPKTTNLLQIKGKPRENDRKMFVN